MITQKEQIKRANIRGKHFKNFSFDFKDFTICNVCCCLVLTVLMDEHLSEQHNMTW